MQRSGSGSGTTEGLGVLEVALRLEVPAVEKGGRPTSGLVPEVFTVHVRIWVSDTSGRRVEHATLDIGPRVEVRVERVELRRERVVRSVGDFIAPDAEFERSPVDVELARRVVRRRLHRHPDPALAVNRTHRLEAGEEKRARLVVELPRRLVDERSERQLLDHPVERDVDLGVVETGRLGDDVRVTEDVPDAERQLVEVRRDPAGLVDRFVPLRVSDAVRADRPGGDNLAISVAERDVSITLTGERDRDRSDPRRDAHGGFSVDSQASIHRSLGIDHDLRVATVAAGRDDARRGAERTRRRRRRRRCRVGSRSGSRGRATTGTRRRSSGRAATATTASGEDEERNEADGGRGNTLPHVGGDLLGCLHG